MPAVPALSLPLKAQPQHPCTSLHKFPRRDTTTVLLRLPPAVSSPYCRCPPACTARPLSRRWTQQSQRRRPPACASSCPWLTTGSGRAAWTRRAREGGGRAAGGQAGRPRTAASHTCACCRRRLHALHTLRAHPSAFFPLRAPPSTTHGSTCPPAHLPAGPHPSCAAVRGLEHHRPSPRPQVPSHQRHPGRCVGGGDLRGTGATCEGQRRGSHPRSPLPEPRLHPAPQQDHSEERRR